MSWQSYVDSNLLGTKKIAQASIIGHDGNTWATSKGFGVSQAEGKEIVAAFANPQKIIANGLVIKGVKYMPLRYDDRAIYGKKGPQGCICVKTKQAVLIALYAEGSQPGECNVIVEKLADYLVSVGY